MTDMELLDILGGVRGKYILEAQKMREGRKKSAPLPLCAAAGGGDRPDFDVGDFPEHRTRRGGR